MSLLSVAMCYSFQYFAVVQQWIMQRDEEGKNRTITAEGKVGGELVLIAAQTQNKNVTCERREKEKKQLGCRQRTNLDQMQLQQLLRKRISINNKELLSHATLIWLAWHFHYMLMNYGWWDRLLPSECNWTFTNQLLKCQTVWNIKGGCCYFGDESKQTGNLELIEKRIHADK